MLKSKSAVLYRHVINITLRVVNRERLTAAQIASHACKMRGRNSQSVK